MKKMAVIVMALSLAVSLLSVANADNRTGMGGGCGDCAQKMAPSEQLRKFQVDTIDLRQEMMMKRFDMQRENLKGTPDQKKIAALQADIKALQAKIHDIRSKSGLSFNKCDGECGPKMSGYDMMKGMGGCGKGTGGCNGAPCGGQK